MCPNWEGMAKFAAVGGWKCCGAAKFAGFSDIQFQLLVLKIDTLQPGRDLEYGGNHGSPVERVIITLTIQRR